MQQPACALMLPPSWVTVAVDDAMAGQGVLYGVNMITGALRLMME